MRKISYFFKSLVESNSGTSSKSFGLLLSSIIGGLIGLCVCFCLIWDITEDAKLDTDLDSLGIFLLCDGAFMFGGGINKVLGEKYESKQQTKKKESNTEEIM
jgi:hypothetical protein